MAPGLAIMVTVLLLNLFGDVLRDVLDRKSARGAEVLAIVLGRILRMVVVMFGIPVVTFAIFFATPASDPAARIAGRNAAPEAVEAVRKDWPRPATAGAIRADDEAAFHHARPDPPSPTAARRSSRQSPMPRRQPCRWSRGPRSCGCWAASPRASSPPQQGPLARQDPDGAFDGGGCHAGLLGRRDGEPGHIKPVPRHLGLFLGSAAGL